MDKTKVFNTEKIQDAYISETIREVVEILEEKGYNPINQIVGYLMSDDPGYISSYKGARKKLTKIEPSKLIEVLVKEFIK